MQYLTNFHSHCVFCDGCASMEAFVHYAVAKGLKAYGISSHAPVPFIARWAMNEDDLPEYLQEFARLKKKYADRIELYVGMEIDYLAQETDSVFKLHSNVPLDYRIGSIHYIDTLDDLHWNVGGDPENYRRAVDTLFDGDIRKMVVRYFEQTCHMIEHCHFDIIGHMDKITDLAERLYPNTFHPNEKWYTDLFRQTLELVKQHDVIVEINTKNFTRKGRTFPHCRHYKTLLDMHIPVMVNTDCHRPDLLCDGISEAYAALSHVGFKSVRILKHGQWTDEPINIQTPHIQ